MEYTSVSIPKKLIDEIKKVIDAREELGYANHTEFIKEAIRSYLSYVKMDVDMKGKVDIFDRYQKLQK